MAIDELIADAEGKHEHAKRRTRQSQRTEEVHGASEVLQQEPDSQNIEQDAESAAEAVVRFAGGARRVADGDLGDPCAVKDGQGRNETAQLAKQLDILQNFGPVRIESSAEVAQVEARGAGHHPVGYPRRQL